MLIDEGFQDGGDLPLLIAFRREAASINCFNLPVVPSNASWSVSSRQSSTDTFKALAELSNWSGRSAMDAALSRQKHAKSSQHLLLR
jgi:hypothetical protein